MAAPTRPASRVAFVVLGGPLTVLLIAVFAIGIMGTLARQSESTPLVFTEAVTKLRVHVTQGSITLRGGELSSITGERILTRGIQSPSVSERVDGDTLVVEASCIPLGNTWCDVSYVLDVPSSIEVRAESALGDIQASGISGPVDLRSATGTVSVEDLSGTARLESGAGSVDGSALRSRSIAASSGAGSVSLAFDEPPTLVDAGSGAGSLEIVVPRDATAYRIEEPGQHDSGNLRIAVTTDPTSSNVLRLDRGAGSVSVHYPEA